MKSGNIKYVIIIFLTCLFLFQTCAAGEKFRYIFSENDTLDYTIKINSRIEFKEHKSLAQLFNLDNMTHDVNIKIELITESVTADKNASIKAIFRQISSVMIAGDSVFIDDGSKWGALKPGSEYVFIITPRGEIIDFYGEDTTVARQGMKTIKLFFPTFPKDAINENYSWDDSLNFEFQTQKNKLTEIHSQIAYVYKGIGADNFNNSYHFGFTADGISSDKLVSINGDAEFYINKTNSWIIQSSGDFNIDALLSLSDFGFSEGIGSNIPINIQSKLEIEPDENR